jgi:aminoglycoside/choline kinase family phosphotransferase
MNTTRGLLWTDWEDTFAGPVEWDVASAIWNAKLLDADDTTANVILKAYHEAGGHLDNEAMHHSLIGRAAVMTAWYPILYPNPNPERQRRLQHRLDWLAKI